MSETFPADALRPAESAAATPMSAAAALNLGMRRLLFGYLVLVVALSTAASGLSTDALVFIGLSGVLALALTRTPASGWLSLLIVFAAWQAGRGVAATFDSEVVVAPIVGLERLLAFGMVPSIELQRAFHDAGVLNALDIAMTGVYAALVVPIVIVAAVLWRRAPSLFYRFLLAFLALSLGQFAFALLVPVAPPRLATEYGTPLAVVDIVGLVWAGMGDFGNWLYTQSIGNPVAALPSLHSAYPVLAFLAIREIRPRVAWLFAGWSLVVFFAVLYLGHHYLIDVYAGVGFAAGTHVVVRRWWQRALEPEPAPVAADAGTLLAAD